MFHKLFDWLDRKMGKSGKQWSILLEATSILLPVAQIALIFCFPAEDLDIVADIAVFLLVYTPLAIIALCFYPLKHFAKKEYGIWITWERGVPLIVLGIYVAETVGIVQRLLKLF